MGADWLPPRPPNIGPPGIGVSHVGSRRAHSAGGPAGDRAVIVFLTLGIGWAAAVATQYVAARFAYHPHLGPVLVRLDPRMMHGLRWGAAALAACAGLVLSAWGLRWLVLPFAIAAVSAYAAGSGPLYAPHKVFVWYAAYHHITAFAPIFRAGWLVFAVAAAIVSGGILAARRAGVRLPSGSHGSAAWGSGEELRTGGRAHGAGFLLGRDDRGQVLRYAGDGHLLTVAPTRSGKGIGCVVPNLLTYTGSVVVTDVKGELFPVTARHRRTALQHDVCALDPFGVLATRSELPPVPDAFNPLDLIDPTSDGAIDNARLIADMLVITSPRAGDAAFWDEEARSLLTGLILYVAAYHDADLTHETASRPPVPMRTLGGVRDVLTAPPVLLDQHFAWMAAHPRWAGGLVARAAARLAQKADRERSGVISCAQNHTHFLDSPRMGAVLGESTRDLRRLTVDAMSVYIVLPYERLDGYARWVRLMVACTLIALVMGRARPRERVLFLLDEFEALGQLPSVQRAIALAGGFGAAFWLFLQDLAQLKGTYPEKWGTFLANTDVFQCFGTNDLETADYVSRLVGDATITVESDSRSRGVSRGRTAAHQEGNAVTVSETARRLLLPDEVRRLPSDRQLLFVKGCAPILARRLNYLTDAEFARSADPNPLYAAAVA